VADGPELLVVLPATSTPPTLKPYWFPLAPVALPPPDEIHTAAGG
jgi:hypothetical protein